MARVIGETVAFLRASGRLTERTGTVTTVLALGLALLCLLGVLAFHFPQYLTTPLLRQQYSVDLLRWLLFGSLLVSGGLALSNVILDRRRILNTPAFLVVLAAVVLGGASVRVDDFPVDTPYIGLDLLILDLLASTLLFALLEKCFPLYRGQPVFRPEWHLVKDTGTTPVVNASIVQVAPNVYQLEASPLLVAVGAVGSTAEPLHGPTTVSSSSAIAPRASKPAPRPLPDRNANVALLGETPSVPQLRKPEIVPVRDGGSRSVPANSLALVAFSAPVEASARLMISNGMGREGWAAHNARLLEAQGIRATRVTNYQHYGVEQTMILFREGQRAQAERIMVTLPAAHSARLIETSELPSGVDIRLVLGRD